MKTLLTLLALTAISATAFADIQDPPMNDYGPTRKLGRALANIIYGFTEVPNTACMINERMGNEAAGSYGAVKGVGRFLFRFGAGVYELVTFPFPLKQGSYKPPYKSNIPWIHGGFEEFPPELGWKTKYNYGTTQYGW